MSTLFFVVLIIILLLVVAVLVRWNESLKTQHRDYVSAVSSVYDDHSNVIIGLQQQIEELLERRTNDYVVIDQKDLHIAGLVKEIGLKEKTINDLSFRNEALELRVKEVCSTSDELYRALKEATK